MPTLEEFDRRVEDRRNRMPRTFWRKFVRVFLEGDTHTIRVLMAVASLIFGAGLLYPGHDPFASPILSKLAEVTGPVGWGVCYVLHGVLVLWRTFDPVPRRWWAFWINAYGLILWLISVGLINAAVHGFWIGTAMEITILLAAAVALVRTGINDEKVSP